MARVCLTCGHRSDDLEGHHVAGRLNISWFVVAVCVDCHRILTAWQYSYGFELDTFTPRNELDTLRSMLVGVSHLMLLYAQRHPERSVVGFRLAAHTARAMSKLLDATGDPNRPGRWLPDPTMPPTEATPVAWPAQAETEWFTEWAHLLRAVADHFGEESPISPDTFAALAAKPDPLRAALESGEPVLAQALAGLVDYVTNSHQIILRLLTVKDPTCLDEQLLDEATVWFSTGHRLLADALRIALTSRKVSS